MRHPGNLSERQAQRLIEVWEDASMGTALEKVKAVVLEEGMELEVIEID